jgi:integrase
MKHINNYTKGIKSLYQSSDANQNLIDAYIDLRLYQPFMLTDKEINAIDTSNIIFLNETTAYIYLEDKGVFDNIEIPPYRLLPIYGENLIEIFNHYRTTETAHPFSNINMKKEMTKHRNMYYPNMSLQDIRMSAKNNILISSSPLEVTLKTSRTIMSSATIAELSKLFPYANIAHQLLKLEKQRIANAINRTKDIDNEEDFIDSSFSMDEFDYFNELLSAKNNSLFMKKVEPTKRELLQYINSKNAELHGILIAKYIVHLLDSITGNKDSRKIAISTFKDYYLLLKRHLFENIEDISNVQTHEINTILQNLAINRYADASIAKVRSLISDFFKFHGEKHNTIPMNLASYPKSLVLESEIDPILTQIEDAYHDVKNAGATYVELRDKTIVLMARYTGLRKNELRSRMMKDVYIYGNKLCIDVNSEGPRKLDLRLKTSNAKRRVCTKITNQNNLEIILKYMEAREKVRNKNPFLFLHVDEHNKIKPKVAKEDVFNQIGKIIQVVTGRYTSFHSLRHTFATYAVRDILQSKTINPYKMIDLAVKMGHTSPEVTLKKYVHLAVIEMFLLKSPITEGDNHEPCSC